MPPNVHNEPLHAVASSGNIIGSLPESIHDNDDPTIDTSPEQNSVGDIGINISEEWVCPASEKSIRTINPIRAIVDPIVANSVKCGKERGDGKDQISLALGDPTAFGNFEPCPAIVNSISSALRETTLAAGYVNACGTIKARSAIASHHSAPSHGVDITPEDVIVASGCSGALELALTALLDEGSVLLVPRPGFPLYQVIAESHGARVVHYDLMPDEHWECDLHHMERLILELDQLARVGSMSGKLVVQQRRVVRGIVINNPSNPTGSVYSERHLCEILDLAKKYRIPIVADEIYGDLTYGDAVFHPLANVASKYRKVVPIITASGLGKQFLVPGWRVGWLVFYDGGGGALRDIKDGAKRLAQVILGASHLVQCAVPAVLAPFSDSERLSISTWKSSLQTTLENQAGLTYDKLQSCPGLSVIAPQGAMYVMVRISTGDFDDHIQDDVSFTKLLLEEENVFALPGQAFGASADDSHFFRVVFCAPQDILLEAFSRIKSFCTRHVAKLAASHQACFLLDGTDTKMATGIGST